MTRSVYSSSSLVPEDRLQHEAHGRDHERGEQRVAERVDPDVVGQQLVRELQHERVGDQDEQEAGDEHERQPQRGEHRRQRPR